MTDAHIAEPLRRLSVPIADLTPDPANARKHGQRNLDAIKASLAAFGQRKPLVVQRQGMIVRAGNGTMQAAKALGWEHIAAVVIDEDSAQAVQFAIADNRTAELAEWDDETLASLLDGMDEPTRDMLAFDDKELAGLMRGLEPDEIVEDEAPEPPADPITQPGDLWTLGQHRLLCGDSTVAADVSAVMNGERADLWLTDPPYNVDYTGGTADQLKVANDNMTDADFRQFLRSAFTCAFDGLKPGAAFYIWHADSEGYNFRGAVRDSQQVVRQCLVWTKDSLVMGRQDYQWQHEPCLYGWKDGASHAWFSDRKQTTLLQFERPKRSEQHPTMKPVALFAYLLGNSTGPQGLVYDGFMGSGTTLVAAEQLGRRSVGIEMDPAYCDVIVQRWEALTGQEAVRNG
jgi:site-specific DNA-methyltransferase (adenine-specific)